MTFDEAFAAHLAEVDRCYAEYRKILADRDFNNRMNRDWTKASGDLKDAVDAVFALKDAWLASRALLAEQK